MIDLWAKKWKIPDYIVNDLIKHLSHISVGNTGSEATTEKKISGLVRIEASQKGCLLWRNNVGVLKDERGVPVRYGLANDSVKVNKHLKSSDLIGIRSIRIQQKHVGSMIGQFTAREVKKSDWEYKGTERERAQLNFLVLVNSYGGNACFVNGEGSI